MHAKKTPQASKPVNGENDESDSREVLDGSSKLKPITAYYTRKLSIHVFLNKGCDVVSRQPRHISINGLAYDINEVAGSAVDSK